MDGLFLINKEKGMTSHDVVFQIKKKFHVNKVGHAGTLDPFATGLLVVCINKATKTLRYVEAIEKEYIATIQFGSTTNTGDYTGEIIKCSDILLYSKDEVEKKIFSFLGECVQTPPMFSALKVNGKKLCDLARQGIEVERKTRSISIKEMELISYDQTSLTFRVICSKGTYIRVLGEEIAQKMGMCGHLLKLQRTKIGKFCLEDAQTISDISEHHLQNIKCIFSDFQQIEVEENLIKHIMDGKPLTLSGNNQIVLTYNQGVPLAIYEKNEDGLYKSIRGLW